MKKENLADALIATTPTNSKPTNVVLKTKESNVAIAATEPSGSSAFLPLPNMNSEQKKLNEKPLQLQTDKAVPEPVQKKTPDTKAMTLIAENTGEIKKPSETMISPKEPQPLQKEALKAKDNASVLIPIKDKAIIQKPKETIAFETMVQPGKIKPAAGQETPDISIPKNAATAKANAEANNTPVSLAAPEPIEKAPQKLTRAEKKAQEASLREIERKEKAHKGLKKIQIWEAKEGTSLKKVLANWSEQTNAALSWDTKESYDLTMDLYVSGTFENALKTLFSMGVQNGPQYKLDKESATLVISE